MYLKIIYCIFASNVNFEKKVKLKTLSLLLNKHQQLITVISDIKLLPKLFPNPDNFLSLSIVR